MINIPLVLSLLLIIKLNDNVGCDYFFEMIEGMKKEKDYKTLRGYFLQICSILSEYRVFPMSDLVMTKHFDLFIPQSKKELTWINEDLPKLSDKPMDEQIAHLKHQSFKSRITEVNSMHTLSTYLQSLYKQKDRNAHITAVYFIAFHKKYILGEEYAKKLKEKENKFTDEDKYSLIRLGLSYLFNVNPDCR